MVRHYVKNEYNALIERARTPRSGDQVIGNELSDELGTRTNAARWVLVTNEPIPMNVHLTFPDIWELLNIYRRESGISYETSLIMIFNDFL